MSIRIYISFLFLVPALLSAQVVSNGGQFSVDFDRGCSLLEVNITELDTFGVGAPRLYFYGDGSPETTSTNYTYPTPGTFQILQIIGAGSSTVKDSIVINAFEPTETQFSVEKCNLNGVSITSEEQVYDFIRVYFTPTDSAELAFGESDSWNYTSSSNQSFQTKGFYDTGKENCTVFFHTITTASDLTTPTITSSSVKETCRDYYVLELELANYDSLTNYQIEIVQVSSSIIYSGKINSNQIVVQDISYSKTESQYCVKVNAVDNCTDIILNGEEFCTDITELSSTPFENLYSSYTTNSIFLNMDAITSGSLQIYRKLGENGTFELRASVQNAYSDPIGSLAREYFYRIDYLDSCEEVLFSAETNPPIHLR